MANKRKRSNNEGTILPLPCVGDLRARIGPCLDPAVTALDVRASIGKTEREAQTKQQEIKPKTIASRRGQDLQTPAT